MTKKEGNSIIVNVDGAEKPWNVLLRGIYNVKEVVGASYEEDEFGVRIIPEKGKLKIKIKLL